MSNDYLKVLNWFEGLIGDYVIKIESKGLDGVDDFDEYDMDRYILTRKVLYYDQTNKVLSTHSPYGTHWETRKDVVKIKSTDNFRWAMKGDEYLSTLRPCNISLERQDGTTELLGCCNERNMRRLSLISELIGTFIGKN